MERTCKSFYNGKIPSIGTHDLDDARKTNEDIVIINGDKKHKDFGKRMTVRSFMFHKFFEMGKKTYWDPVRQVPYRLAYIQWTPDKEEANV